MDRHRLLNETNCNRNQLKKKLSSTNSIQTCPTLNHLRKSAILCWRNLVLQLPRLTHGEETAAPKSGRSRIGAFLPDLFKVRYHRPWHLLNSFAISSISMHFCSVQPIASSVIRVKGSFPGVQRPQPRGERPSVGTCWLRKNTENKHASTPVRTAVLKGRSRAHEFPSIWRSLPSTSRPRTARGSDKGGNFNLSSHMAPPWVHQIVARCPSSRRLI